MHIVPNVARTRVLKAALALAAISLLAACGGDSGPTSAPPPPPPPPPPIGYTGSYKLYSISDSTLPHIPPHPQGLKLLVDSGSMKLNADSTYAYSVHGRQNDGDSTVFVAGADSGTFTESGTTVSFKSKFLSNLIYIGTATDSSLAIALQGSLLASMDNSIPTLFKKVP